MGNMEILVLFLEHLAMGSLPFVSMEALTVRFLVVLGSLGHRLTLCSPSRRFQVGFVLSRMRLFLLRPDKIKRLSFKSQYEQFSSW